MEIEIQENWQEKNKLLHEIGREKVWVHYIIDKIKEMSVVYGLNISELNLKNMDERPYENLDKLG